MKYGVGITTRNRPEVLESCLQEHARFCPNDTKFVIVDDASDDGLGSDALVAEFSKTVENVVYKKSSTRLGISKAKNACLAALADCDHVFLFDDDAWPIADNWAEKWVDINVANGIGHSMFNVTADALLDLNQAFRAVVRPLTTFGNPPMVAFSNCFGVMLYFSRDCLNALGGYQNDTPHLYGYEHAQMSNRASLAGFTKGHSYVTPLEASDLIYSIDISYCMLKIEPSFPTKWLGNFKSSVTMSESSDAEKNSTIMHFASIHIPLVNPLPEETNE